MQDYGKLIYDLLPTITVSGNVFPSLSFGQDGWLIRRGFFSRNVFVYSTEKFDQEIASYRGGVKITINGKVITRAQNGRTLMVLPLAVVAY